MERDKGNPRHPWTMLRITPAPDCLTVASNHLLLPSPGGTGGVLSFEHR